MVVFWGYRRLANGEKMVLTHISAILEIQQKRIKLHREYSGRFLTCIMQDVFTNCQIFHSAFQILDVINV